MEINMKDTLRTLRQKKGITQENLASYLGITPQSVGKWERGEGFPDITLLPKIALYFNVTIDELLNVGKFQIERAIKAYQEESMKLKNSGENDKNIALWEEAYAEFPNDCRVMEELMSAIYLSTGWPCSEEKAERIIFLGERILHESMDTIQREIAIQTLCFTYKSIGDKEKALEYAKMGGSFYTTREYLQAFVLEGEEGVKSFQEYLVALVTSAASAASSMLRKAKFTSDEQLEVYQFGIDLLKMLFSDDNVAYYGGDISKYYLCISRIYAQKGDMDKTLESIENSMKYALISSDDRKMQYTAPLVNRLTYNPIEVTKTYKGNHCALRLKDLGWKGFDFVRESERFRQTEKKLKEYAQL